MSTADTTTEAFADTRPGDAADLPDYAPIPKFGDLSEAIIRTGSFAGEFIGEPSAELETMLAGGPIRLFTPYLWP
jgi:hypothetical protein